MDCSAFEVSKKFHKLITAYFELEESSLPTNDPSFQSSVQGSLSELNELGDFISSLDLYSDNETIKEMPTKDLKYFLLPILWALFTLKKTPSSKPDVKFSRLDCVKLAEQNIFLFLKRIHTYQATTVSLEATINKLESNLYSDIAESTSSSSDSAKGELQELQEMAVKRNEKIERFIKSKELKEKVHLLLQRMKTYQNDPDELCNIDEDSLRNFYLTLIGHFTYVALEELDSIAREKQMLILMESKEKSESKDDHSKDIPKPKKSRQMPFIITKNKAMKEVFGLGYPSIPVMSIDDFISNKMAEGTLAPMGDSHSGHSMQRWAEDPEGLRNEVEDEDTERERARERDDPTELARQRAMDNWKDDNPRGAGNRYNRS